MVYFPVICTGLWFLGRRQQVTPHTRCLMIGLACLFVLALLVILPDAHPLHRVLGGHWANGWSSACRVRSSLPIVAGWAC